MRSFIQIEYDGDSGQWMVYVDEYTLDYEGQPYWTGYVAGAFDSKIEAKNCAKKEEQKLVW